MTDTFGFRTTVLEQGRMLAIELHGASDLNASLASMRSFGTALVGTPVKGVVMDYSRHYVTYQIEDFEAIAKAYCDCFPIGFPVAFVYKPDQVARVIFMTRRLEENGRPSRAFAEYASALDWLQEQVPARDTASKANPGGKPAAR